MSKHLPNRWLARAWLDGNQAKSLHLMGMSTRAIAETLTSQGDPVEFSTVARDIKRCRRLWREHTGADIDELKAARLAQLGEVKRQAWLAFLSADKRSMTRPGYLNQIRLVIADEAKMLGLNAAQKRELTGKDGAPLPSVDVLFSPDWIALKTLLLQTLERHPEAKTDVLLALGEAAQAEGEVNDANG